MGNMGRDYAAARRQAQANANLFQRAYVITGWGVPTDWHVDRRDSYTNLPADADVVEPETRQVNESL